MYQRLRTLTVVLFMMCILSGGKCLSSASATTPTNPETATMKFTYFINQTLGSLYTDEVFVPYTPDSGFSYSPTNPAIGFGETLRDYDNGVDGTGYNFWVPIFYPFTFTIPVSPYGSYTAPVPYLCTPSYYRTPGANTKTVTAVDHAYTFYPTPPIERYPFINDGSVTHSGTVNLIQLTRTQQTVTIPLGETVNLQVTPNMSGPNEKYEWSGAPGATASGGNCTFTPTSPGAYSVTCVYSWDEYQSGWWDWEETILWNARPVQRLSIGVTFTVNAVQAKITSPIGNWCSSAPFRYDYQGVVTGTPGAYALSITGSIIPGGFSPFWTLTGGGTFGNGDMVSYAATPGHIPPTSAESGTIILEALGTGAEDQQDITIFDSHLTRDITNEGQLTATKAGPNANCGTAAHHAYNGGTDGAVACPYIQAATRIYDKSLGTSFSDQINAAKSQFARGKVIIYGGVSLSHIETLTGSGSGTWGANTPANPGGGNWSTSSIGLYYAVHSERLQWIDLY